MCVFHSGCPPFQGSESSQQNMIGVLETAMKIANQDADADDDEDGQEAAKVRIKKISAAEPGNLIVGVLNRNASLCCFK